MKTLLFKKKAILFIIFFTFFSVSSSLFADEKVLTSQADFQNGMYQNTFYDSQENGIKLQSGQTEGVYESQVFDLGTDADFDSFSWMTSFPVYEDLPDRNGSDTIYQSDNISMNGNILLFHFENPNGGSIVDFNAIDYSGNGNDSENCNLDCPENTDGIIEDGRYFSNKRFFRIKNNQSLNPQNSDFTICHWFKMDALSGADNILYNKERHYEAAIRSGRYYQYAWQPHWNWDGGSSFRVDANKWYFACVVYDHSKQYLYKNGQLVYSRNQTGDIGSNNNDLCLGGRGSTCQSSPLEKGTIDEFSIWNRALSADEIQSIYKRGVSKISIELRSCDDPQCLGENYQTISLPINGGKSSEPSVRVHLLRNRYFQFRLRFRSFDENVKPLLTKIQFSYRPVNHPPTDIRLSTNDINENVQSGTTIATLSAVDQDPRDTHTYFLVNGQGSEDNNLFQISGNQLKINFTPDYENPVDQGDGLHNNTYSIRVRTLDQNRESFEKSFILRVIDVDEDKPQISLKGDNPFTLFVGENYVEPGYVATDLQDGDITYRVQINGNVDSQKTGTYILIYSVSDNAGNIASVTRTVIVKNKRRKGGTKRVSEKEVKRIFSSYKQQEKQKKEDNFSSSSQCLFLNQNLKKGYRDGIISPFGKKIYEVKTLQKILSKLEYKVGPIDGIFGEQTENAVKSFQEDNKLSRDGIVGEKTRKKINNQMQIFCSSQKKDKDRVKETPQRDKESILKEIDSLIQKILELRKLLS